MRERFLRERGESRGGLISASLGTEGGAARGRGGKAWLVGKGEEVD